MTFKWTRPEPVSINSDNDRTAVGVHIAQPTFCLNRYQQMIGRGLRGPKNGGSETVLIVNVKDNADAFGEQLAFHHFDALWNKDK